MILSRYRLRASVTERLRFWVNVTDRPLQRYQTLHSVTLLYIALQSVTKDVFKLTNKLNLTLKQLVS